MPNKIVVQCGRCNGTGTYDCGMCSACGGTGGVIVYPTMERGARRCGRCNGSGIYSTGMAYGMCSACGGTGWAGRA